MISYAKYKTKLIILECSTGFSFFFLFLEFAQSFHWHEKKVLQNSGFFQKHTGQCKRTGGCYNELVVAFFSTGGGVKGKKINTC